MVIPPDHRRIGMTQPVHHHPLRDAVICALTAEEMPEAVQATVREALLARPGGEPRLERLQDFLDQDVSDGVRLDPPVDSW